MENIYQPQLAKIVRIKQEAPNIKLFRLKFLNSQVQKRFFWQPGQFIELSIPGFGEAPFALCSSSRDKHFFEICVRQTGQLTNKLHQLKVGDSVGIRGPFGHGFPEIRNQEVLLVVGGLGIIPLRSFILTNQEKLSLLRLFYGVKKPSEFLFKNEFQRWQKMGLKLHLTIDKACPGWDGCVGVVTVLFDKVFGSLASLKESELPPEETTIPEGKQASYETGKHPPRRANFPESRPTLSILCGPPVMYKFVLEKLNQYEFKEENIYLSLERRMHCGIGVCQHCAIGPYYVCKDGPVFRYSEIKNIFGAI